MSGAEPTLKCVIAWSDRRNLCSIVADTLQANIGGGEILRLGDGAVVTYAANEPAQILDWVQRALEEDESVLVVEFERWSAYGRGVDATWLLGRGH
jgi:hypothetical protein